MRIQMQALRSEQLVWYSLLFLLLIGTQCAASQPEFLWPDGTLVERQQALQQAFRDAITLARVVAATFDPCEDVSYRYRPFFQDFSFVSQILESYHMVQVFLWYFQPIDGLFVNNVFRTIANMPLPAKLDDSTIIDILSSPGVHEMSAQFNRLVLSVGDHPDLPSTKQLCERSENGNPLAFTFLSHALGDWAWISFCEDAWQYPSLDQIYNPVDANKGKPGWGCDGLGDHDSEFMTTLGGLLLHELMHWTWLLYNFPNFDDLIGQGAIGLPQIGDFPGPEPADGYGSLHAKQLKSVENADNYRCYAESKYWQYRCGRPFKESMDAADDLARTGTRFEPAPPEADPT